MYPGKTRIVKHVQIVKIVKNTDNGKIQTWQTMARSERAELVPLDGAEVAVEEVSGDPGAGQHLVQPVRVVGPHEGAGQPGHGPPPRQHLASLPRLPDQET